MLELSQPALVNFSSELYGTLTIWTDEKGREFFKAVDVCSALKLANVSQSLKRYVDPDYVVQFDDGSHRGGKTNYLSEPGLYQLIFSSKTDWAKQFQRWVFEEVLPKLRADGGYIMDTVSADQYLALQDRLSEACIEAKWHQAMKLFENTSNYHRIIRKCGTGKPCHSWRGGIGAPALLALFRSSR
jgi:prophage antirepressor-like protein